LSQPPNTAGGRRGALRYLVWQFDPDVMTARTRAHWAFLLREGDAMHVEYDAHQFGLFPRSSWLRLLRGVGFQAKSLTDPYDRDVFVAVRSER
jgi:hypothetical protein